MPGRFNCQTELDQLQVTFPPRRSWLFSVFFVNTSSRVSVLSNTGSLSGTTRKAYAGVGDEV